MKSSEEYYETLCYERVTFNLNSRRCSCAPSLSCYDEDGYDQMPQHLVRIRLPIILITVLTSSRHQLIRLKATKFGMMLQCLVEIGFQGKELEKELMPDI